MSFSALKDSNFETLYKRLERVRPRLAERGYPDLVADNVSIFIRAYLRHYENKYMNKPLDRILTLFSYNEKYSDEKYAQKYLWIVGGNFVKTEIIKTFLFNLGVPVEHIVEDSLRKGFYEYIYKTGENPPRFTWFPRFTYSNSPNYLAKPEIIFNINADNWEDITPYPINVEELMLIIYRESTNSYIRDLLSFQPVEAIQLFTDQIINASARNNSIWNVIVSNIPPEIYQSKRFLINFIGSSILEIKDEEIKFFFGNYHDPTGERRKLVEKYIKSGDKKENSIFRALRININEILAYPPYWFEEQWLKTGPITVGNYKSAEAVSVLIQRALTSAEIDALPAPLYITSQTGPIRLPTHHEIGEMILNRHPDLKRYSKDAVSRSAGVKRIAHYENDQTCNNLLIIAKILNSFERIGFTLYTKFDMCPHEDDAPPVDNFMFDEYSGYVITYGNYFNLNCMSMQDLINAFVATDEEGITQITFRKPYSPNEVFSRDDVGQLEKILTEQPNNFTEDFAEQRIELIGIISIGISKGIDLKSVNKFLTNWKNKAMTDKKYADDLERFKNMMIHLFYAGMYQRTWKGPGNPYPLTVSDASDVDSVFTQYSLDTKMGPELSEFMSEFRDITPEHKIIISRFPMVYDVKHSPDGNDRVTLSAMLLIPSVEQIIGLRDDSGNLIEGNPTEGRSCVGGMSGPMIYTAYMYMSIIGESFSGFDLNKFNPESKHRTR